MSKKLIIIPTYNESINIVSLLEIILSFEERYDILVIDDNSPDKTSGYVKQMMNSYGESRIFLKEREAKLGLGTAYIYGFNFALNKGYDFIFEMDADFSHNPTDLKSLLDAVTRENYDIAIGSRYINGVRVLNWPIQRLLISYLAGVYVRVITRMPIADPTSGFICYSNNALKTIPFKTIHTIGYAFQVEMKFLALNNGLKIKEVPIVFTDRINGKSKMSKGIIVEAIVSVIRMKILAMIKNLY